MLDIFLLAKAVLVGALAAAIVMRLASSGAPRPWRCDARWSWAIGAGLLAASGTSGQWPQWPALEDRARFLTLLAPLTVAIETLAATCPARGAWTIRLGLAAVAAPVLLHNSVYLADLNGRDSAQWPLATAIVVLAALAVLLVVLWTALTGLQRRASTAAVQRLLALDALAAAVTVMLSGYFGAGLLGLGLAGAIAGATSASGSSLLPSSDNNGSLGMSVVGVFTVVLVGRFFGSLSTGLALCLLLAPLLAWIVELPRLRKLTPGWRGVARWAGVAVLLLVVVIVAQRRFTAATAARSRPPAPRAVPDPGRPEK